MTFRLLLAWARLVQWWQTDVWGWIIDVPCSNPDGGHCLGRRSNKPVPCPRCDGETC